MAMSSSSRPPRKWSRGPQSPYGIHKFVGEQYLAFYRREHGLRSTVLRYGNVYGPRQDPHGEAGVVAIFVAKLLRGEQPTIYAYPDQADGMSRDYVYVEDVAQANLRVVDCAAEGTFNIAGGRPVRTRELLDAIGTACRAGATAGVPAEGAVTAAVAGARPGDLRESWLDITRVRAVLGWQPQTTLADGLARTVAALRKGLR